MQSLESLFRQLESQIVPDDVAQIKREKRRASDKKQRDKLNHERLSQVAVLDMETDPFDNQGQERIFPFAACLASDHFDPIEIWDEDQDKFVHKVVAAIESLPGKFTIYAHNGGKFDYLFFVHRLRGQVSFKGRGIMAARIGQHELRDSFHILPEKLAAYRKDAFDYEKMRKGRRHKYKDEIKHYLRNDCLYLLDFIKRFVDKNGLKLSIGQAALAAVKQAGINVASIGEAQDTYLRQFYFGGRVECLQGLGEFHGTKRLYDVNSMYPDAMASKLHPVGKEYLIRRGRPSENTCFIDLCCDNYGAFVCRDDEGGTTASKPSGRFYVSIFEYEVALKYNLIDNVKINYIVDCEKRRNFADFVIPFYNERQALKQKLKGLSDESSEEYLSTKFSDLMLKLFLNNAYGKYAQNPRNYRETFITDYNKRPNQPNFSDDTHNREHYLTWVENVSRPEWGALPVYENEEQNYAIWEKPVEKLRFKNVGTAASITGAARAVLLEAICNSTGAIYCDTDSLICDSLNADLDPTRLGAWDLEDTFDCVRVAGKKLYACRRHPTESTKLAKGADPYKIASKGIAPPTWEEFGTFLDGLEIQSVAKGPTLTRRGTQSYVTRTVRATAKPANRRMHERMTANAEPLVSLLSRPASG